ncbi:hypothetical protein IIA95_02190 [Patescibacteria group bacterium]|nr:hypothetical protein [Patescibacteria group bacterium]
MNRILSLFVGALMLVSFCAVSSVYASDVSLTVEVPVAFVADTVLVFDDNSVSGTRGAFVSLSARVPNASWYFSLGAGQFHVPAVSERGGKSADRLLIGDVMLFWFEPGIEIPLDSAHHYRFLFAAVVGGVYWKSSCCNWIGNARGFKVGLVLPVGDAWSAVVNHRYVRTGPLDLMGITSVGLRFNFK